MQLSITSAIFISCIANAILGDFGSICDLIIGMGKAVCFESLDLPLTMREHSTAFEPIEFHVSSSSLTVFRPSPFVACPLCIRYPIFYCGLDEDRPTTPQQTAGLQGYCHRHRHIDLLGIFTLVPVPTANNPTSTSGVSSRLNCGPISSKS